MVFMLAQAALDLARTTKEFVQVVPGEQKTKKWWWPGERNEMETD